MAIRLKNAALLAVVAGLLGVKPACAATIPANEPPSTASTNTQVFDGTSISLTNAHLGRTVSQSVHSRVWAHVSAVTNRESKAVMFRTNTVNEIAAGLNRVNANNQLLPASPEIAVFKDGSGAAATSGMHHCFWPADAGANGDEVYSLKVAALNGQTLKFKPVGVALHDFVHDNTVWISQLKNNCGGSVQGNSVIYADCMDNQSGHRVDIVYSNSLAGVEQNFVFKQRPGAADLPEAYGMDPRNVWLECWTEIFGLEQEPQIQQEIRRGWQKSTIDKFIKFGNGTGAMTIIEGTAFGTADSHQDGLPVHKHYVSYAVTNVVNGLNVVSHRKFLIEEISWRSAAPQLAKLGQAEHASAPLKKSGVLGIVSNTRIFPHRVAMASPASIPDVKKSRMKVAEVAGKRIAAVKAEPSFWVDFNLVNSSGDIVLEGGKTWYVSGAVYADTLTIEPTAVIKMTNGAFISTIYSYPVACLTTNYAPAIFTAYNDNTVGDVISTDPITDTTRCASIALNLIDGGDLHNLQFRYADTAIRCPALTITMRDLIFTHCDIAVDVEHGSFWLDNSLMMDVGYGFYGNHYHGYVQHLTYDQGANLAGDTDYTAPVSEVDCVVPASSQVTLVNSLLTSYGSPGIVSLIYGADSVWLSDNTGVYTNVGAGGHYLPPDSPYRGMGTAAITSDLAQAMKRKTTQPPVVFQAAAYADNPDLVPQVPRETSAPYDPGYAYDPIDFAFGYVDFDNVPLTIAPGTSIATFWASPDGGYSGTYGVNMIDSAQITCVGTPQNPVHFFHYNMVQEQANANWVGNETMVMDDGSCPLLSFRFTGWSAPSVDASYISYDNTSCGLYNFQDCEFQGGLIHSQGPTLTFTNCLFDRVSTEMFGYYYCDLNPIFRDCLFRGGNLSLTKIYGSGTWIVKDNLFDHTALYQSSGVGTISYNGYVTNCDHLDLSSGHDVILTNSPAYQVSTLGRYYYPTNLPLINVGSQNSTNAGLYHYTTTANQVKETNSIVDIGYHYVAACSGAPCDTDGDGLADYLEDANGNGTTEGAETSWQNADTDGDGVSDYIERLQGRHPLIYGAATDTNAVNLQIFTPLQ